MEESCVFFCLPPEEENPLLWALVLRTIRLDEVNRWISQISGAKTFCSTDIYYAARSSGFIFSLSLSFSLPIRFLAPCSSPFYMQNAAFLGEIALHRKEWIIIIAEVYWKRYGASLCPTQKLNAEYKEKKMGIV